MTVSSAASKIYQAAKKAAAGEWAWRAEWSKAMKMAWEKVINTATATAEEIAEEIAETLGGNVWANYGKLRVYVYKNFLEVTAQGLDLSGLGRNDNEEMKKAAHDAASKYNLDVYEIYRGRKISA